MSLDAFKMKIVRWKKKISIALVDQGAFSGASFIVHLLLARWLDPQQYGAFAVTNSIFLLVAAFHTAILTEPMMIFGAGKYSQRFSEYFQLLLRGHWGIVGLFSFLFLATALILAHIGQTDLVQALYGYAIASPFILLLWLTRRSCYVHLHPQWALPGSVLNLVVSTSALYILSELRLLSTFSAIVSLGLSGMLSSVLILSTQKYRLKNNSNSSESIPAFSDHWIYGRWNILAVIAFWASGQVLIILIPMVLGLSASAAVAAVYNLFRPLNLIMQSSSLLILPIFSKLIQNQVRTQEFKKKVIQLALLFAGGTLAYGIILSIFSKPALNILYEGKYDEHWILVILLAISTSTSAMISIFTQALKAQDRVKLVSIIWGFSALVVSVSAIPLMIISGLEGAMLSVLLSYAISVCIAWRMLSTNGKVRGQ